MSPAPSPVSNSGQADRPGARRKSISGEARKQRLRRHALESLEPRTLLATIPAAITTAQASLSAAAPRTTSDESTPSIAVNQANPMQVAAVWTRRDPGNLGYTSAGVPIETVVQGAFSSDGGQTWRAFRANPDTYLDPTTSNPIQAFTLTDNATAAFDRNGNLYVLTETHNTGYTAGALVLYKYDVSAGTPRSIDLNNDPQTDPGEVFFPPDGFYLGKVVYEWDPSLVNGIAGLGAVQAWDPVLAVDDNVAAFTDPSRPTYTQNDPYSGNVYVAWTVYDPSIDPNLGPRAYNLAAAASSDGGNTFKAPVVIDNGGGVRNPRLSVSQGRPADLANGLAAIPGGTVSFTWDDYYSAALATPPQTIIKNDHANAVVAQNFAGAGGPIADAVDPGGSQPHTPATTFFPINVNLNDGRFTTIDRLDIDLSINHAAINEIQIRLIPPAGSGLQPIVLLNNRTNDAGANDANVGASGAGLGFPRSFQGSLDTVFSASAFTSIFNNGGGAASIGYFRPEGGILNLRAVAGKTAADLNGIWRLEVTDFRAANTGSVVSWGLTFSAGMNQGVITPVSDPNHYLATPAGDLSVATSTVLGADPGAAATLVVNQSPLPVTANPVIATDNTLGAFSPYQGKSYIAYTDRYDTLRLSDAPYGTDNPADNTDIRFRVVDLIQTPFGPQWQVVGGSDKVNDDDSTVDGHTQAIVSIPLTTGRAQFMPSVAVDQTTGTLVMSWYDGRDDASNSRVATYLTTSIDGGATFAPDAFVNTPQAPYDESIRRVVEIGPLPDNLSAGNPNTEATIGFGPRQGLAVFGGKVYPIWTGNRNAGADGASHLDVFVAQTEIAGGPRAIASTMGPVRAQAAVNLTSGARIDFNNRANVDGVPIADGFLVTFDRPVDPSTFTIDDIKVFYRSPNTPGTASGIPIPVLSVTAVDSGLGRDPGTTAFERQFGATQFLVRFADSSFVGTYSYTVGPNVSDRIRSPLNTQFFYAAKNAQNLPAIKDNTTVTSSIDINVPAGEVLADVNVLVSLNHQRDSDIRIRLIPPPGFGLTPIILADGLGGNAGQNYTDTTFDDQAARPINFGTAPFLGSYQSQSGRLGLLNGFSPNGLWKLEITDSRIDAEGQLLGWGLAVTTRPAAGKVAQLGNAMDQNANGVSGENPAGSPLFGVAPGDVYAAPLPSGLNSDGPDQPVLFGGSLARDPLDFSPTYTDTSLPLQVAGPRLAAATRFDAKPAQSNLAIPDAVQNPNLSITPGVRTSTITIGGDTNLQITDLNVRVSIAHARVGDLRLTLVAPDGTAVPLAVNDVGTGFDNTLFDDQATTSIDFGTVPVPFYNGKYAGSFVPSGSLYTMVGRTLAGTWTLQVEDYTPGITGTLVGWSLDAQTTSVFRDQAAAALTVRFDRDMDPASLVNGGAILQIIGPDGALVPGPYTVVAAPTLDPAYPDPNLNFPRTYQVLLPAGVRYSGSYVARLSPAVTSRGGDALDINQNAGLDNLRGVPSQGTEPITYNSSGAVPIGGPTAGAIYSSPIKVDDNFLIQNVVVQINITFPNDPLLEAYLLAPDGVTTIQLFKNLPAPGANFTDTIFDDFSSTPITNAGPKYSGRYAPQPGLGGTLGNLVGLPSQGTWNLVVKVDAANVPGRINYWNLTLARPVSSSGLGEAVADRADLGMRVFTMDPTNPLSSNTWTAVGPAGIGAKGPNLNAEVAGRVNNVALDPSDPSGNTAFAATPGGGVWKTTNFLTNDPTGPTWISLLDDAPIYGISAGDVALFPRNGDPNQTVVFVATGDGQATGDSLLNGSTSTSRGVGFLRSNDGGKTWTLLDSLDNVNAHDHYFASVDGQNGVTSFRLIVDPNPLQTDPTRIILYAAVSDIDGRGAKIAGDKGGIYRSTDSGNTWTRLRAGQATDILFDPSSQAPAITVGNPPNQITRPGNLQYLYAAFRGEGVFFSPNGGDVFNPVLGDAGDPLIQNAGGPQPVPVPVNNTPSGTTTVSPRTPNEVPNGGQIVLAKPAPTGNALQDLIYRGWLYAAIVQNTDTMQAPQSDFVGLYLTKDFGDTWTKIQMPAFNGGLPTNTFAGNSDPTVTGNGTFRNSPFHLGNFNLSLAVDPNNPNVVYLGGTNEFGNATGLIRVDATGLHDAHAFFLDSLGNDGGLRYSYVTGSGVTLAAPDSPPPMITPPYEARVNPYMNLIRDPADPFRANSTILVQNTALFVNDGGGASWVPFDKALAPDPFASPLDPWSLPTRGVHRITTLRDPLTGQSRLIFSTDSGVYTVVADAQGRLVGSVGGFASLARPDGDTPVVNGTRNGNLQIAQFYDGASQPSQLAADLARLRGFFYGSSENTGTSWSDPKVLEAYTVTRDPATGQVTALTPNPGYGNLSWSANVDRGPSRGDVATQQELQVIPDPNHPGQFIVNDGGAVYFWRSSEGSLNDDGRPSTDTWRVNDVGFTFKLYQSSGGGDTPDGQWTLRDGYTFAVNPLDGDQAVIGSSAGRIFATKDRGLIWAEIGNPGALDSSKPTAIAFGAPDPGVNDVLKLDDYVLVGTTSGHVYVTFTGGGTGAGAGNAWLARNDGLDGSPVRAIVTDPTRGSFRAYVVTEKGVYLLNNVKAGGTWTNISGSGSTGIFGIQHNPFGGSTLDTQALARVLTSMVVDWRYVVPDVFGQTDGPTHPLLYVGGSGGVFRSLDNGSTWARFPDSGPDSLLNSPLGPGGGLPNAIVNSLDLALGSIDPQTGRPNSIDPTNPPSSLAESLGPNTLTATTYGRGAFTIRLAPIVFPNSTDPTQARILKIDESTDSGRSNSDQITNVVNPLVDGYSEQTAFGNLVRITLFDLTDPANPRVIGGYDPSNPATDVAANWTTANGTFQIRINDGVYVAGGASDGVKTIGVQATNISGTKGNLATFQFTLDTVAPLPSTLPDLVAADDTGLRDDDEITNPFTGAGNGALNFTVTFDPDPTGADTQLNLFRGASPVGIDVLGLGSSPVVVTDPAPIPNGARLTTTYGYRVRLTDLAGNQSDFSPQLNVRVDNQNPAKPGTPKLAAGMDTGSNNTDNITNIRKPVFTGQGEPNALPNPNDLATTQANRVELIDSAGNVIGIGSVASNGFYSVAPTNELANGIYTLTVRVRDVAGNTSVLSDPITIEVRQLNLPNPTLTLLPLDDSGTPGDNVTNIQKPRLSGTGTVGLTIQILDLKGNVPGSRGAGLPLPYPVVISANDSGATSIKVDAVGSYLAQILTNLPAGLPEGEYKFAARILDIAGNTAESAPLTITIQLKGSTGAPSLTLDPNFDTGARGDGVTSSRVVQLLGTGALPARPGDPNPTVALFDVHATPSPANELARTVADSNGNFTLRPPKQLSNGTITLVARTIDLAGNYGDPSTPVTIRITTAEGDFNGAEAAGLGYVARADISSYSRNYSNGQFSVGYTPNGGFLDKTFAPSRGLTGDKMIPFEGDFDGDGLSDYGVFDYSTATWYINQSSAGPRTQQMGWPGVALPIPADYDGDGRTDIVVFQPNQAQWVGRLSGGSVINLQLGWGSDYGGRDQAVPADYDGDGKADLMLYRPQTAEWLGKLSNGQTLNPYQFGWPGVDVAAPADYNGDGKADLGLYRPQDGTWLVKPMALDAQGRPTPGGGYQTRPSFASAGDIPAPLDLDGDGKADLTVFRPSTTQWFTTSTLGNGRVFGPPDGLPLAAPLYPYRLPGRSPVGGGGGTVSVRSFSEGSASSVVAPPAVAPPAAPPASSGLAGPSGSALGGPASGSGSGYLANGLSTPATPAARRHAAALARRQLLLQRLADWRATRSNASLAQAARPSAALALIFGRRLG